MTYPPLFLKKNEEKRLRSGHLWVFSNEVDIQRSPLEQFEAGNLVSVNDANDKTLGIGYVNPHSLISVRLLTRQPRQSIDEAFFLSRLQQAHSLRERLYPHSFYRLVFGESDGLPGLIVDRFGSLLSIQISTAGMERLLPQLLAGLTSLLQPQAVVINRQTPLRLLENLTLEQPQIIGELPEIQYVEENGCRFQLDIVNGQKTGWFFDHRDSRLRLAPLARNQNVLDLFCYSGAWGIQAAKNGANSVTCVDASETALNLARNNAALNGVVAKTQFEQGDAFAFLKQAREQRRYYQVIILDPPALIKRKKDFKAGLEAYQRLNRMALQVLAYNGTLVSASCSHHLSADMLQQQLRSAARHVDRHLVVFQKNGQSPDHPVHPSMSETEYLKTFFCSVTPSL